MAPILDGLPAELVLRILAYLPVQSLRSVRLTSRSWNTFFIENESSIYHHAALHHRFINSIHTLLPEAKIEHPLDFLQEAPDWYDYCRKYFQLQRNWAGRGSATIKYYGGHPYDIHRLKVDEKYGLLIVTHEFGGLTVYDLYAAEVLWHLSTDYVRRYAHCEYENGFLIFDRVTSSKEVWRLDVLFTASEIPRIHPPDDGQLAAWKHASLEHSATGPRGHFRPWACIEVPEPTRAYRFVYPTLLVCGPRRAFLWDVRTMQLLTEVENVQGDAAGGEINYVEVSAVHVFVCSSTALRVFSRENGALQLELKSYQLVYADVRLAVHLDPSIARHKTAGPSDTVPLPCEPTLSTALYTASYAEFSAVHVSRDGRDIVAQLSDSRLVLIRDFQRVIRGEVPLESAMLESGKTIPRHGASEEHFSIYLAYEHGRLGVVTTSGVYAATLDPTYHGLLDEDLIRSGRAESNRIPQAALDAGLSFPHISFISLPFYHDRRQLAKVTCIQITETKLFFVWDRMYCPEHIDLFRRLGFIRGNTPTPPPHDGNHDGDDEHSAQARVTDILFGGLGRHAQGEAVVSDDDLDVNEDDSGSAAMQLLATSATETSGAGPSHVPVDAMNVDDEWEEDVQEDSEEEDDEAEGGSDEDEPPGAQFADVVLAGPIVFCIDFTPR